MLLCLVEVGNHGANTNSASLTSMLHSAGSRTQVQWDAAVSGCTFMITLNEADHLDGSRLICTAEPDSPGASEHLESKGFNQIIGRVVRGMEAGVSA